MAVDCFAEAGCLTPGTCAYSKRCVNGGPEPEPPIGFRCDKCGVSRPAQRAGEKLPVRCSDRYCQGALVPILRGGEVTLSLGDRELPTPPPHPLLAHDEDCPFRLSGVCDCVTENPNWHSVGCAAVLPRGPCTCGALEAAP